MRKKFVLIAILLLSGCVTYTNPVPPGYTGSISDIYDSVNYISDTESQFFIVSKVNGKNVENSLQQTAMASYGQGFSITHMEMGRGVPVMPLTIEIQGATYHAAPILALRGRNYNVKGTINFTPKKGKSYNVKGVLNEERQAVWVEDASTQEVVTEIVEKYTN